MNQVTLEQIARFLRAERFAPLLFFGTNLSFHSFFYKKVKCESLLVTVFARRKGANCSRLLSLQRGKEQTAQRSNCSWLLFFGEQKEKEQNSKCPTLAIQKGQDRKANAQP